MMPRIERLALPLAFAIIVLVPGLGIALIGRNLASQHQTPLEVAGVSLLLMRTATLAVVLLSIVPLLTRLVQRTGSPATGSETALLAAFLLFFATNVMAPAAFGAVPGIEKSYFYVLALFLALFAARRDGGLGVPDAVKWSIVLFLLLSLAYAVLRPDAALRFDKAEQRLPFVPFRLWGLGTSPNSIGPMALTALLLTIVSPFRSRLMHVLALTSAGLVLLLAQSQTTWIATALILPPFLLYRRHLRRHGPWRVRVPSALVLVVAGVAMAALVIVVAHVADAPAARVRPTPGLGGAGDFLTGRGSIWRVALDTLAAHPLFGYGLFAWGTDFRAAIAMPYAFHAHNQLLQSLSVAGLFGGLGLVIYLVVLVRASLLTAAETGGLAPALVALAMIGSISEAPFDLAPPLLGDTMRHALLFGVIMSGFARSADREARRPAGAAPLVRESVGVPVAARPGVLIA